MKRNRKYLVTQKQLEKAIAIGMIETIKAHGNLKINDIQSVTKRVLGVMKQFGGVTKEEQESFAKENIK